MSAWLAALAGVGLGAVAALVHLAITRWRARLALARGPGLLLITYPLALASVALFVLAAAWLAPLAAWCTLLGLLAVRAVALGHKAVRT